MPPFIFPIIIGWDYIKIIFKFSVKECSAHIVHIWQFYIADPYDWKRPLVQSFNGKDLRTDFENCILSGRILCLFNDSLRRQKNIHCEILQRNYNVPVLELLFLFKMVFKNQIHTRTTENCAFIATTFYIENFRIKNDYLKKPIKR